MNSKIPLPFKLLVAVAACLLSTGSLSAYTVYTTADNSVASGDYQTEGNVLFGIQTVYFGTSGTAELKINSDNLVTSYNFYLGAFNGSDATLKSTGYLQCYNLVAAQDSGSSATIILAGGKLYTGNGGTGSFYIGQSGNATMTMTGGSTQFADTIIAENSTSTSSLTLEGGTINCSASLHVGMGGTGTMTMTGGIVNTESSVILANISTGNGTLDMSGGTINCTKDFVVAGSGTGTVNMSGGTINCTRNAYVGNSSGSTGIFTMTGGTTAVTGDSYIGYDTGSTGTATVTGSGSTWTNSGALYVGYNGKGTLNIEDSGTVTSAALYLVTDTSTLKISSGGSFTCSGGGTYTGDALGEIDVGYDGVGTLTVENGGTVKNGSSFIGYNADSTGTVTVKGSGSTWTNSNILGVGCYGTGTLNIEEGGSVSNVYGLIGGFSTGVTGTGTVTVTGSGSTWTNSSILYVGCYGTGTLNIEEGGSVSANGIVIGYGSTGTVTVTGSGSKWINSNALVVGYSGGTGTLNITSGALVTATTVSVDSGSALYIKDGFLALSGTGTDDTTTLQALLNGGTAVYAWDSATSQYVLLDGVSTDSNYYGKYVTLTYYSSIANCVALSSSGLSGAYTVLTSLATVPEPATCALFGGICSLGLALRRRK
jgi:fibronectin-binding autotransporter adhesin